MEQQDDTDQGPVNFEDFRKNHALPAGAEERIVTKLKDQQLIQETMKSTNYFRIAAAIGGIIIAFFAGRFTTQQDGSALMNDGKQSYLLLLREDSTFNGMDIPGLVSEYTQWARDMASRNQLVGAEKLTDESYVLGTLAPVDGPGVTGYFIIRATDLSDAQAIAQSHPHLKYNGGIELRPIDALDN